jgi:hypothetical protein
MSDLVNEIVEELISKPKRLDSQYGALLATDRKKLWSEKKRQSGTLLGKFERPSKCIF